MAKHDGIFRRLFSDGVQAISAWSFLSYFTSDGSDVPLSALPDNNSLVTKGMLQVVADSIPGAIPQVTTPIVGGTTPNPITVPYTGMENPTLIFRNADGSNYSGAVNNVDTGTDIVLTGDDDGTGHFADSFSFVIKP